MSAELTTLHVDFVSESAGYRNTFGWYNKVTGEGGILFADIEAEGRRPTVVAGMSSAEFSVETSQVANIGFFLIPDGGGIDANSDRELSGPIKVIQLANGSWAVATVDSNGNVETKHGKPNLLKGEDANAFFTETSKNAGGVDYASSTVGKNQNAASLSGDTADGPTGLIAWEDLAATKKHGGYSKPGDADYNDAVFRVSVVDSPDETDDGNATVAISGTAQEDSVLTAVFANNDPDGAASGVSYQWQRNGVDIDGATASTYTLGDDDVGATITVEVDYTDGQGFAESIESAPTAAVTAFDDGDATVAISGTAQEDSVLTAVFANNDPDGAASGISYQWQRNGFDVLGATDAAYTLGDDDVGATITVEVDYTDGQGFAESSTSDPTAAVAAVNDPHTGVAAVAGTATEDQVLTADTSGLADADGLGAFSYQWQRNGFDVLGATDATYTLGDADVGATITVKVDYTDGQGFAESSTSDPTAAVAAVNDPHTGVAAVAGTATEDQVLTADTSGLADADGLGAFSYQWQRNGFDVLGATDATYTLGDADVGATITVKVDYTDGQGFAESSTSDPTAAVAAVNDPHTGVAAVAGTATEDQVLTADTSGLADADGLGAFSYQWQRNGFDVLGATDATYTLGDADVGATITVKVDYTDGQGFAESSTSDPTAAVAAVNDPHTGVAAVAGTATEDQVLTADTSGLADADGLGAFSYQWQRNGFDVLGATDATYTLGDADVGATITVKVDYTDGQGFAESSTSDPTAAVAAVNDPHTGVAAVAGTATEDQVLTADTSGLADADGLGAFSYQWQRNGFDVLGATDATYTLGDADVGATITVKVDYTDGQGFAESSTSDPTAAVAAVNDPHTGVAAVAGTATEDQVLTADTSGLADADGLGAFSYQWQRNGFDVLGATDATYTLGDADVGATITVKVDYTDGQGFAESSTSDPTAAVAAVNDPHTGVAAVAGTATEDQVLTADTSGLADADGLGAFSYQWQRNGFDVLGATDATYTLGDADVGATITVKVDYTDGQGFAESSTSDPTAAVAAFDDGEATVTITGTAQQDQLLTANFGNNDPDGAASGVSYQWQRNGVDIALATSSTYTLAAADVGATITVEVDYTDGQGFIEAIESAPTAPVAPSVDINDAPVLNTAASPVLTSVLEDAAVPAGAVGTLVSALVNLNPPPGGGLDNVTDPDSGAVTGIAITATGANGTWSYSLNNGGTWTAVGAVSTASALLLAADADTRLYFRPNANFDGDSTITFRAWDQTSGAEGTKVDTTINGGTTAYSTATDSAFIDVIPVNDPPSVGPADRVSRINLLQPITVPEWALLRNDSDIDSPATLDVNGVTGWTDASSAVLTPGGIGSGSVIFNDSGGPGGTFTYQATDGALLSGNATVLMDVNPATGPITGGWDVIGFAGSTILIGTTGTDRLSASTGNDILIGGQGNDALSGIAGDDWYGFNISDGTDTIRDGVLTGGGGGNDRVVINASISPVLSTLIFARVVIAAASTSAFIDELQITYPGGRIDVLDHYNTSQGSMDQMQFLGGASFLGYVLGTGVYNIIADGFAPTTGTGGNDVIASSSAAETLTGFGGNDLMFGNAGNDTLNGGTGNDLLVGGADNDTYTFAFTGDGTDTIGDTGGATDAITIAGGGGAVMTALNFERVGNNLVLTYNGQQVTVVNQYVAGQAVESVTFSGGETFLGYSLGSGAYLLDLDLSGGGVADVIASTGVTEVLSGNAGNDLLFGNAGNDTINGNDGNDLLMGGAGIDTLSGGNNDDVLVGGADGDTLTGGAGADSFVLTAVADSPGSSFDVLLDFQDHAAGGSDLISLAAIDANPGVANDQAFSFVAAQNAGAVANSVTWFQDGIGGNTIVQADVDGNIANGAELTIFLAGLHAMQTTDFIL